MGLVVFKKYIIVHENLAAAGVGLVDGRVKKVAACHLQ